MFIIPTSLGCDGNVSHVSYQITLSYLQLFYKLREDDIEIKPGDVIASRCLIDNYENIPLEFGYVIIRLRISMHLKIPKYACTYALKIIEICNKNPKYA